MNRTSNVCFLKNLFFPLNLDRNRFGGITRRLGTDEFHFVAAVAFNVVFPGEIIGDVVQRIELGTLTFFAKQFVIQLKCLAFVLKLPLKLRITDVGRGQSEFGHLLRIYQVYYASSSNARKRTFLFEKIVSVEV